jgi:isoleucyl-tRNA synthetase
MSQTAPIIPVIDERLTCHPTAPSDHKMKVEQYNDLLEDIYQREVELSNIKSTLLDMRDQIAQEVRILNGSAGVPSATLEANAIKSDSSESDEAEQALSDSSSGARRDAMMKKGVKKTKAKAKLGHRRSKVPDAQLSGEWDYRLELGRSSISKRGRRASGTSDSDVRL